MGYTIVQRKEILNKYPDKKWDRLFLWRFILFYSSISIDCWIDPANPDSYPLD